MSQSRAVGKYTLLRELGRGGMGIVYEATDTQVQRTVALKLMLPRPGLKPEQAEQERQRFAREAQMAAKLKHPGIVTLYEAGEIQGRRYLAMEYVEGQPYSGWMDRKDVGLRAKIAVLRDVALAVHHAHEQGVLHRDLKPQNILVAAKNRPVVMDFGLAKAMGGDTGLSLTGDGLVVGTPAYMSPEQARGDKAVDGRTDVYSLGVILYELLAGRQPFTGESAIEILMKASKERAPLPSGVRAAADPAIDRTIENICLKALERHPQDRYASARAFASDLTRWLDGEAVHVTTSVTRRRFKPPPKSRAWIFVSIGAAALVVIAAIVAAPGPAPAGAELELDRARRYLREKRYSDARVEYGKALAKDPLNAEALEGDRKARAAEEAERAALARELEEKRLQLEKQLDAARAQSAKEVELAEQRVKAAATTASEVEQKRLIEELEASREKARRAEEEARKAREKLMELASRPAPPPPAPAPAPPPPPPPPPPAPKEPEKPPGKDPKLALALLKDAMDEAVDAFDLPGIFAAAERYAADGGADVSDAKADGLRRAKKLVKSRDDAQRLASAQLRLADEALMADDVKAALQAAREATAIAKAAGEAALAEEGAAAAKDLNALQPETDRFLRAKKALAERPDEPGACADAGRYLCFVKGRWEEGLALLAKGSDEPYHKLAQQEAAAPADPAGQRALAGGWWAAAQKERVKFFRSGALLRALRWYELALPVLRGAEKVEADQRIDALYRQLPAAKTRVLAMPEKCMKPLRLGFRSSPFPEQKTDDPTGPFRGEPVYYDQTSGTELVFEVRSGRRLTQLRWKAAGLVNMSFEVQDMSGATVAKSGPLGGGNTWVEGLLDFPPLQRFTLRIANHVSHWLLIDTLELR